MRTYTKDQVTVQSDGTFLFPHEAGGTVPLSRGEFHEDRRTGKFTVQGRKATRKFRQQGAHSRGHGPHPR